MTRRLSLRPERVHVVHNGLNLDGYSVRIPQSANRPQKAPVLGFFARMSKEKGLDTLVEAFIHLKNRDTIPRLKLHIGGGCGPGDEAFVKSLRKRLAEAGFIGETMFAPNLSRAEKISFLESITVFSVPASYGEAFGLYVIEAMAAGVPVVQPRTASFPELVAATGGGLLCEPGDARSLADALESLFLDPAKARSLGEAGRNAVSDKFRVVHLAEQTLRVFHS